MTTTTKLSRLDIERLPNHTIKTAHEWSSSCPFCGGEDRFIFWPDDGNYWCRKCEASGFVGTGYSYQLTPEQLAGIEARREQNRREEQKRRQQAIDKVMTMEERVIWYHQQVQNALDYWTQQGLSSDTIERYKLGYADKCPTYQDSPSYVIPIYQRYKLVSIRHRLARPNGCGKYRPEFAGLPAQIFNVDALQGGELPFTFLHPNDIILVEGEVKTMVLDQLGFKVVGIPGFNAWTNDWQNYFDGAQTVYIAFDPGSEAIGAKAYQIGKVIKSKCYQVKVASIPTKPDDFFVKYKGGIDDFVRILKQGRAVR
jgi:DNA primase